jgi:hypothetical protein
MGLVQFEGSIHSLYFVHSKCPAAYEQNARLQNVYVKKMECTVAMSE